MTLPDTQPDVRTALTVSLDNTLGTEISGLNALRGALTGPLGDSVAKVLDRITGLTGRLVVSGMGKSGHIARKIAATLASTGTPSLFMHPGEASHGDLGMVTREDAVLALSWSGETRELADITSYTRRYDIGLFAMTSDPASTLARAADVAMILPPITEACPNGLAPTTSTLVQLALGDAIAVALLERRRFSPADFRVFHPGGKLGTTLLNVRDVMRPRERVAVIGPDETMGSVILEMTRLSIGCAVVSDGSGGVAGIITDGDLRRHMGESLMAQRAAEVMTTNPLTIGPDMLASEALARMAERRVLVLIVERGGRFEGVLTIADLMARGLSLPSNTL